MKVVGPDILTRIGVALVLHPRIDIDLFVTKEITRHLTESRRPERVNVYLAACHPGVIQQRPILKIMIRMVMRDENVAERAEAYLRAQELACDTVAAIDDVRLA